MSFVCSIIWYWGADRAFNGNCNIWHRENHLPIRFLEKINLCYHIWRKIFYHVLWPQKSKINGVIQNVWYTHNILFSRAAVSFDLVLDLCYWSNLAPNTAQQRWPLSQWFWFKLISILSLVSFSRLPRIPSTQQQQHLKDKKRNGSINSLHFEDQQSETME